MCQCMWGCLIIQWLAKSQALKKDVTLLSILSLKCSMSTGLVCGPHCAMGLIYWTRTQLCRCGFISAHSKMLSCPAVTPLSPPYSHDLTELNAQPPALMLVVTWQHCQTQWGLFFSAITCYVWFLGDKSIQKGSANSIAGYMDFDKAVFLLNWPKKDHSNDVIVFSFIQNCNTNVVWGFWMSLNGRCLSYLLILPGFTCREYIQAECVLWAFSNSLFLVDTV